MTKADRILGISLLGISILTFLSISFFGFSGGETYVSIQVDGKEVQQITLPVEDSIDLNIQGKPGYNKIHIEQNRVWITESNCPDKLCVLKGKIHRAGDMIVCVPNRIVIEIKATKNPKDSLDSVNY